MKKARKVEFANTVKVNVSVCTQDFQLEKRLDNRVIALCRGALAGERGRARVRLDITNEDRAFSCTLSYHIAL